MKYRSRKSFASAVTRIQSRLTDRVCAEIVDRSPSLVRKWSNPAHPSLPNLEQAIALDTVFLARGLGRPPIHETYARRLGDLEVQGRQTHVDIREVALSMTGIVGELSNAVCELSPSRMYLANRMPPQSRTKILKIIERLRDRIDLIDDALCVGGEIDEDISEAT